MMVIPSGEYVFRVPTLAYAVVSGTDRAGPYRNACGPTEACLTHAWRGTPIISAAWKAEAGGSASSI